MAKDTQLEINNNLNRRNLYQYPATFLALCIACTLLWNTDVVNSNEKPNASKQTFDMYDVINSDKTEEIVKRILECNDLNAVTELVSEMEISLKNADLKPIAIKPDSVFDIKFLLKILLYGCLKSTNEVKEQNIQKILSLIHLCNDVPKAKLKYTELEKVNGVMNLVHQKGNLYVFEQNSSENKWIGKMREFLRQYEVSEYSRKMGLQYNEDEIINSLKGFDKNNLKSIAIEKMLRFYDYKKMINYDFLVSWAFNGNKIVKSDNLKDKYKITESNIILINKLEFEIWYIFDSLVQYAKTGKEFVEIDSIASISFVQDFWDILQQNEKVFAEIKNYLISENKKIKDHISSVLNSLDNKYKQTSEFLLKKSVKDMLQSLVTEKIGKEYMDFSLQSNLKSIINQIIGDGIEGYDVMNRINQELDTTNIDVLAWCKKYDSANDKENAMKFYEFLSIMYKNLPQTVVKYKEWIGQNSHVYAVELKKTILHCRENKEYIKFLLESLFKIKYSESDFVKKFLQKEETMSYLINSIKILNANFDDELEKTQRKKKTELQKEKLLIYQKNVIDACEIYKHKFKIRVILLQMVLVLYDEEKKSTHNITNFDNFDDIIKKLKEHSKFSEALQEDDKIYRKIYAENSNKDNNKEIQDFIDKIDQNEMNDLTFNLQNMLLEFWRQKTKEEKKFSLASFFVLPKIKSFDRKSIIEKLNEVETPIKFVTRYDEILKEKHENKDENELKKCEFLSFISINCPNLMKILITNTNPESENNIKNPSPKKEVKKNEEPKEQNGKGWLSSLGF